MSQPPPSDEKFLGMRLAQQTEYGRRKEKLVIAMVYAGVVVMTFAAIYYSVFPTKKADAPGAPSAAPATAHP